MRKESSVFSVISVLVNFCQTLLQLYENNCLQI